MPKLIFKKKRKNNKIQVFDDLGTFLDCDTEDKIKKKFNKLFDFKW